MFKNFLTKIIFIFAICFLGVSPSFAEGFSSDFSPLKVINTSKNKNVTGEVYVNLNKNEENLMKIDLEKGDSFCNLTRAVNKFVQCNIRASWEDFKVLINKNSENDFLCISFANKMADLGLFDLANLADTKIKDRNIANVSMDAMRRFYFPRKKLKLEDELFLAEIYSNIYFNNQSSEATNELLKKENLLSNYDYANYLVALGSYKSNFFTRASKYINLAILQNPENLNYQKLKAEIFAQANKPEEALKIVENLKKQNLHSYEYERKINALEQFILYKIKKEEWEKNYHLGYYHYLENDSSKAIITLQNALSTKRKKI